MTLKTIDILIEIKNGLVTTNALRRKLIIDNPNTCVYHLDQLKEMGYIEIDRVEKTFVGKRFYYKITERGLNFLTNLRERLA